MKDNRYRHHAMLSAALAVLAVVLSISAIRLRSENVDLRTTIAVMSAESERMRTPEGR